MHKNLLWRAFLAVIFIITLWYSAVAIYRYHAYSRLTQTAKTSNLHWSVEQRSDEDFILNAAYRFKSDKNEYSGTTSFDSEPYRNQYAAEKAIEEFSQKQWTVWFDPDNPYHSSLQKKFPFKECISAGFLWVLILYFLWIGYYVAKFKT